MSAYTASSAEFVPVDGIRYETTSSIIWEIGKKGSGWFFVVAPKTVFDVSIPRGLRWLFSPDDRRFLKAAALHDEMLRRGYDRITAAAVFHSALVADGVPAWRRLAMLLAVILYRYA